VPRTVLKCVGSSCAGVLLPYLFDYCEDDSACAVDRTCTLIENTATTDIVGQLLWDANCAVYDSVLTELYLDGTFSSSSYATSGAAGVTQFKADYISTLNNLAWGRTYPVAFLSSFSGSWWNSPVQTEIFPYQSTNQDDDGNHIEDPKGDNCDNNNDGYSYQCFHGVFDLQDPYQWNSGSLELNQHNYINEFNVLRDSDDNTEGNTYEQCFDGSFVHLLADGTIDPTPCTHDTCASSAQMTTDLFNLVRQLTGQTDLGLVAGVEHGFCETDIQVAIDADNGQTWSDGATIDNGDGSVNVVGLSDWDGTTTPGTGCLSPDGCPQSAASTLAVSMFAIVLPLVAFFAARM